MHTEQLKVSYRAEKGSGANGRIRREGLLPGIIYGPSTEPLPVTTNLHDFKAFMRKAGDVAPIFDVEFTDAAGKTETRRVALRAIQHDPVRDTPTHLDLYQFDPARKIKLAVPVSLQGTAHGVTMGGVLQFVGRSLRIEATPQDVPPQIAIDITNLQVGETLTVGKVRSQFGFKFLEEDGKVIAHIIALRKARAAGDKE